MADERINESSLTVAGVVGALATIRDGGTWRGPWPAPSSGIDAAGAQMVAALLRAGHAVPEAITDAPEMARLWQALALGDPGPSSAVDPYPPDHAGDRP